MAQAGFTPISLYFSTSAAAVPLNTDLVNGELAINITDGKLYYKDNAGVVRLLASNATSAPVTTFSGGTTGLTPSTATSGAITLSGTLAVANGGTGITSFGTGVATWLGTPSSANLAAAITDETGTGLLVFATTPTITALRETSVAVAASNIDLSLGNYFTRTISGTTTFTVSNVASSGTVNSFILQLTNGGSATVNWFSGVEWAGGTAPTLTASGVDVLGFYTLDGGTNWYSFVLGKAMA
jgi:hypothetical protein